MRALVRLDGFGDAYLFVGRFVDAKVLGFMERTQHHGREYQQMQGERSGIQVTSALIFMIVALLLLFASVWIGLDTSPTSSCAPIGRLITAADRVRSGDLMARVPEEGPDSDEFVMLSRAFNRMTSAARQPAPRADRGQPAARRAPPLHRGRAGRRQRRRARDRRSSPRRPAEPGGAATSSTRTAVGLPGTPSTRCCPASRNCSTRPIGIPTASSSASSLCSAAGGSTPAGACSAAARRWTDPRLHRHLRRHHRAFVRAAAGSLGGGRAPDRARGEESAHARSACRLNGSSANTCRRSSRAGSRSRPRLPRSFDRSTPSVG